jgi:hypothetical protein
VDSPKRIIICAVNSLQLNKWHTNGLLKRGVWQLIAIFGKVKILGFTEKGYFSITPGPNQKHKQ